MPRTTVKILLPRVLAYAGLATMILPAAGCGGKTAYLSADTNPCGWRAGEEVMMAYENKDTLSQRDISIFVRHGKDFPASTDSLPLRIKVKSPDSLIYTERFVLLPSPAGNHSGYAESKQQYRMRVCFPQKGTYSFAISHELQSETAGIAAVGMEITTTNGER